MNCEQIDELLGAYALDALPPDEMDAVKDHLATCNLHAEATDLRAVAQSLYHDVEERTPSAGLKSRLLAAAIAERPQDAARAPARLPARRASEGQRWGRVVPYAVAAVFALVAVGMLAWNVTLQNDDSPESLVASFGDVGSAGGEVIYLEDRELVVVQVHGMDELDEGQTYQLWRIHGDGVQSLGLMGRAPGGTLAFAGQLTGDDAVGVSVEPAGGSDQPTTDPVMVATF